MGERDTTWREEMAWAGGFYDGEGSTSLQSGERPVARVNVAQASSPEVLYRFVKAVGKGKVNGPYVPKGERRNLQWCVTISKFEDVQAVVALLWRWLSGPKRVQAIRVLNIIRAYDAKLIAYSTAVMSMCIRGHKKYSDQIRIAGVSRRPSRRCNACEREDRAKKRAANPSAYRQRDKDNSRLWRLNHPGYDTRAGRRARAIEGAWKVANRHKRHVRGLSCCTQLRVSLGASGV